MAEGAHAGPLPHATASEDIFGLHVVLRAEFGRLGKQLRKDVRDELRSGTAVKARHSDPHQSRCVSIACEPWMDSSQSIEDHIFPKLSSYKPHPWTRRHIKVFRSDAIAEPLYSDPPRADPPRADVEAFEMYTGPGGGCKQDDSDDSGSQSVSLPGASADDELEVRAVPTGTESSVSSGRWATRRHEQQTSEPVKLASATTRGMMRAMGLSHQRTEESDHTKALSSARTIPKRLVESTAFQLVTQLMIVMNSILVGVQTDYAARNVTLRIPTPFRIGDWLFCIYFTIEIGLRLHVFRLRFFSMWGWAWNIFDTVLVAIQLVEELLLLFAMLRGEAESDMSGVAHSTLLRIVRILRAVKVIRVLRAMRMAQDLRMLVSCVIHSMRPFFWSALLLFLVLFVCSTYITQVVLAYRIESVSGTAGHEFSPALIKWYGNIPRAVLTLFQSLTGGVDWNDAVDPLMEHISPWAGFFASICIAFAILAVMNVVTGIFVQAAIEQATELRDTNKVLQARRFFKSLDFDASGSIGFREIHDHLDTPAVREFFESINIDVSEAKCLFEMLDINGSGTIDFHEFLNGCLRLQGPAKALDLLVVTRDTRVAFERQSAALFTVEAQLHRLNDAIAAIGVFLPAGSPPTVQVRSQ